MRSQGFLGIALLPLLALAQPGPTAKDIMVKVDKVARDSYLTTFQKIKLSTCKYTVKSKVMKCTEEPRVRILESVQKDFGEGHRDSRSISVVLEPATDKGIGTLSHEFYDPRKDTDTWIYFPAFGKVKRLVSSSEGEESGSFFGSEFSLEDIEDRKVDEYTYKILKEDSYEGRKVWIIESLPTPARGKKSRYSKTVSWIDQERHIRVKDDFYDRQGKLSKQLTRRGIEQVDSVWVARKATMNNLTSRRATNMDLLSAAFNVPVDESFLSERSLTDFAYRNRNIEKLRAGLKP